jgi:hypothetical protein
VLRDENARLRGGAGGVVSPGETQVLAKADAYETALELCYTHKQEKRCVAPELQYRKKTKLYWVRHRSMLFQIPTDCCLPLSGPTRRGNGRMAVPALGEEQGCLGKSRLSGVFFSSVSGGAQTSSPSFQLPAHPSHVA